MNKQEKQHYLAHAASAMASRAFQAAEEAPSMDLIHRHEDRGFRALRVAFRAVAEGARGGAFALAVRGLDDHLHEFELQRRDGDLGDGFWDAEHVRKAALKVFPRGLGK